ncbi:unnamed protein product [Paramecium sonneborni]|uniref:Uncharacterized protein n=1 Tax=Paramecium sonneborni TaxID=65129 RepID=A0A8S1JTD0_9CILI|nr:unnamed protein product [Paramecium sonneborni]
MSEQLKNNSYGYLMLEFSNFHGLTAQKLYNEEIDIPRVVKQPKRKHITSVLDGIQTQENQLREEAVINWVKIIFKRLVQMRIIHEILIIPLLVLIY